MIAIEGKENFKKEVLDSPIPVIADFYADWCGPCKMQGPILEQVSNEIQGKAKVCKINVDKNRELAIEYEIQSIPTILIIQNGQVKKRMIGLQNKETLISSIN